MSTPQGPQGNPGDILNWPMLNIRYRTDAAAIAALAVGFPREQALEDHLRDSPP